LGENWASLNAAEERTVSGVDHQQAGSVLAKQWSLPSTLRAISEGPNDTRALTVPSLIEIASGLATRIGFAVLPGPIPEWDDKWLSQFPAEVWNTVSPGIAALCESVAVKITLFECQFVR